MSPFSTALRMAGIALLAVSLSGCISVFPKSKPAQLYRFDGAPPSAEQSAGRPVARHGVVKTGGTFARAASSDRILSVTGAQAAYIAESRWVSPAVTLFDEALARAFDVNAGSARLVSRGEAVRADYALRVDVTRFEAVYDQGADAAPMVVVSLRMTLTKADRTLVASDLLEAQARASDNRVSAIVEAYNKAVGDALNGLVAWTNRGVAAGA